MGGLGNQMFQYAVGRAISFRNNVKLKLDLSWYTNDDSRIYKLKYFNIIEDYASKEEIDFIKPKRSQIAKWIIHQFKQRFFPYYLKPLVNEDGFSFNPKILKIKDDSYLNGYWQSELYFSDCASIIRNDFTLKLKLDKNNMKFLDEIRSSNSISLHIRRGDYYFNKKTRQVHGTLPLNYYYSALNILSNLVHNPIIYVFSDDIQWAKHNLKLTLPSRFMDFNMANYDYIDLTLMSMCKYHIIANSSFSWWGAWLAQYKGKIVIAPKRWFAKCEVDSSSLFPNDWILI